jgi:hypothetical protein
LRVKASSAGKASKWSDETQGYYDRHMKNQWAKRSLASLSDNPAEIAEWHAEITQRHGPSEANHAARVLRAIYRRAQRLNRTLPAMLPTSAVEWNEERRADRSIPLRQVRYLGDAGGRNRGRRADSRRIPPPLCLHWHATRRTRALALGWNRFKTANAHRPRWKDTRHQNSDERGNRASPKTLPGRATGLLQRGIRLRGARRFRLPSELGGAQTPARLVG